MPEPIQLEWQEVAPGLWRADHPLGSYYVDLRGWRPSHDGWTACQPVADAKLAAQADFAAKARRCFIDSTPTEKE